MSSSPPPPPTPSTPSIAPDDEVSPDDPEIYERTAQILTSHAQVGSAIGTAAGCVVPVWRARAQLAARLRGGPGVGIGGPNVFVSLLLRSFIWGGFGYFAGGGVGAFGTGQYAMLRMVKEEKRKAAAAAAAGQAPP